ncbi:MAG: Ig domain-containing protein, partial [Betaproteobacteria bacterium]
PSALSYSTSAPSYTVGVSITNNPSSSGGVVISYSVTPTLPAGLTLNPVSGVISGKPSVASATTGYTVTASNDGGSTTATLSITVANVVVPPSALSYNVSTPTYKEVLPIPANKPFSSGGAVTSYAVSPDLPAGLSLHTGTGIISGTPTTASTATNYTVTASNATGYTTATLSITVVNAAFPYDFTLEAHGPNRVVLGHDMYLEEVSAAVITGTHQNISYYVDNLPDGATVSWPTIGTPNCCGANVGYQPGTNVLEISVPATVPTGTYSLTLRAVSGGSTHVVPYTMVVDPVPEPLSKQVISTIPPIPNLSTWETQMTTYGAKHCDEAKIIAASQWEGGVWYYDGMRVFFQIADYTGDASWNFCAGYVENVYKPYALKGATGWRLFPHGLYMDYLRTNDLTSKDAVIALATKSPYAGVGGKVSYGVSHYQREDAYLIHAYRIAGLLGSPNPKLYARSVDFVLGIIDQVFVSKTDTVYMQPFMVGLMMEALIQYYDETKDPRVPPAIKAAVDGLWTEAWIPASNAFYYEKSQTPRSAAPDLNLLIAPAYAWMYKLTGDPLYQQRGDLIFQGGVAGAWLDQGKQFSQNYRWGFDYVNWRLHPN